MQRRYVPEASLGSIRSQNANDPIALDKASAQGYYDIADDRPEAAGLLEYWNILRHHSCVLLGVAFAGGLCGLLVTLPQTPLYQAHASVEIVGMNDNFLSLKYASPVSDSSSNPESSDIQTEIKLLESEELRSRVINKLSADSTVRINSISKMASVRRFLGLPERHDPESRLHTLKSIGNSLKVRSGGQMRVIDVTVDSSNPRLAAKFANTLTSEFIEQNLEARWTTAQKISNWLARQLEEMRVKLERSEAALQAYARTSGLVFTSERTSAAEDKLKQLQSELSAATAERISKQSRYEIARDSSPDSLPEVLNDPSLRESRAKITELKSQIAELSPIYTPEYGKIKRLQAQVRSLETDFEGHRAAILGRIQTEYSEALRREKLLRSVYESQAARVSSEGERSIQYNILKREADSNRQLYETMLQQLKESSIASALHATNVRIVDSARIPERPYKPDLLENVTVGALGALFLGGIFLIARHHNDRRIHHPGDTTSILQLPELGVIPKAKNGSSRLWGNSKLLKSAAAEVELTTWKHKPSVIAESFRSALASLLFASQQGATGKVTVVTSAEPGEGKSTVVSNLGIVIAELGYRVLLIDGDMRRPRQHDIFSLENARGLSSILRERVHLNGDQSLGGMIRPTEIPNLFVLPSGPTPTTTVAALHGPELPEFLNYVRCHFDLILVDTPPMLHIADARFIARNADYSILVIRAGLTTRERALAASERLTADGARILGTILNDWTPDPLAERYSRYYSTEA